MEHIFIFIMWICIYTHTSWFHYYISVIISSLSLLLLLLLLLVKLITIHIYIYNDIYLYIYTYVLKPMIFNTSAISLIPSAFPSSQCQPPRGADTPLEPGRPPGGWPGSPMNIDWVGCNTAWVLYKNSLWKNLKGLNPRRATYFQLYQAHSTLSIWGALE